MVSKGGGGEARGGRRGTYLFDALYRIFASSDSGVLLTARVSAAFFWIGIYRVDWLYGKNMQKKCWSDIYTEDRSVGEGRGGWR